MKKVIFSSIVFFISINAYAVPFNTVTMCDSSGNIVLAISPEGHVVFFCGVSESQNISSTESTLWSLKDINGVTVMSVTPTMTKLKGTVRTTSPPSNCIWSISYGSYRKTVGVDASGNLYAKSFSYWGSKMPPSEFMYLQTAPTSFSFFLWSKYF